MKKYFMKSFSVAGRKTVNQDVVLFENIDDNTTVLGIADGMGGEKGGDIASKIAIDTLFAEITAGNFSLIDIFNKVKEEISIFSEKNKDFIYMGTTLTVALIQGNKVLVGHVGDTRIYHMRNDGIISITKDQTELQKLLDDGIISKQRAEFYHRKNILLSVLTPNKDFEFQGTEFEIKSKDKILLLTDGAYSLISKTELRDLALENKDINSFVKSVKNIIEGREIKDDYSLIALEYISDS